MSIALLTALPDLVLFCLGLIFLLSFPQFRICVCFFFTLYYFSLPQAEKITTILKAANVSVEPYWPGMFAKAAAGLDLRSMVSNVGSGAGAGGGAPAAGAAAPAAAAGEKKGQVLVVGFWGVGRVKVVWMGECLDIRKYYIFCFLV